MYPLSIGYDIKHSNLYNYTIKQKKYNYYSSYKMITFNMFHI